jgi:hypothetical protein
VAKKSCQRETLQPYVSGASVMKISFRNFATRGASSTNSPLQAENDELKKQIEELKKKANNPVSRSREVQVSTLQNTFIFVRKRCGKIS